MVVAIPGHRWAIFFAIGISYIPIAETQCYYPGGAWAEDQFPCDKYAYTTVCCPTGWTCFSNKLCIATDPSVVSSEVPLGTAIRGTCTNPLWNNTACGGFCLNDPVSSNNGSVVACGDNQWCCEPDSADGMCNCNTGKGTFQVSDGTAQTIIGVVGLQHTSTGSLSVQSSSIGSTSQAATTSLTPSSPPSSTSALSTFSTSRSSSSVSRSSSPPQTSTSSLTSSPSSSSVSTSNSAKSDSSKSTSLSTTSPASTTSTGSGTIASQTNQQILDTSAVPVTQTTAFKAGIGAAAGVLSLIILGLVIWLIVCYWRRRTQGVSGSGNPSGGVNWAEPMVNTVPYQVAPTPHPYEDSAYSAGLSRTALAEQLSHNRRTPRPIEIIEENNPYSDRYAAGRAGR